MSCIPGCITDAKNKLEVAAEAATDRPVDAVPFAGPLVVLEFEGNKLNEDQFKFLEALAARIHGGSKQKPAKKTE